MSEVCHKRHIHAETIRELETLISDCSRSKISEYDLWTKADGKQEVKAYLRNLKVIVQDILANLGFKISSIFGSNMKR